MFLENVKLALSSIAANKLRSFLTMLGIIIGIAAVIAIMTVGNSQTEQVREQYSQFGTNNIEMYMWLKDGVQVEETDDTSKYQPNFTHQMIEDLLAQYGDKLAGIATNCYMNGGTVKPYGNTDQDKIYANVSLQGVNPGYFVVNNQSVRVSYGHYFRGKEAQANSYVCIVSDKLVDNLFSDVNGDYDKALGQKVTVPLATDEEGNTTTGDYTIIGIYNYNMSDYDMDGQGGMSAASLKDIYTDMYIPYLNALQYVTDSYSKNITDISMRVKTGEDVLTLSDDIQNFMTAELGDDSNFEVQVSNNKEWIEETDKSMRQQTLTITLIGAIALLVGGIGVMNIMTVSITERTREIGTRKALGAPNGDIRMQFITEAVIICIIGGIIGIAAGVVTGVIMCKYVQQIPVYVSWQSVIGSFLVSLAIGVFFGYYPANKAAKMDPIEALRYE